MYIKLVQLLLNNGIQSSVDFQCFNKMFKLKTNLFSDLLTNVKTGDA